MVLCVFLCLAMGYLLGCIQTGFIIGKINHIDIRDYAVSYTHLTLPTNSRV